MDPAPVRAAMRKNIYLRYLREFKGLHRHLVLGNICAIVQALSLVPISLFFKKIIDTYIPQQNATAIVWIVAAGICLWGINILATICSRYFTLFATKTVTERLRAGLTMKLQQMSLRFHDNEKAADLHARVILDTERVDVMSNALVVHILVSVVIAVAASGLLIYINPRLFVLLFLMMPFYLIIRSSFALRLKEGHGNFRKDMEQMSSIVSELVHSIRLVKSFAMENYEQRRVEKRMQQVTNRGVRLFTQAAAFQILLQCVGGLAMLLIFTVGGWMVMNRQLTIGDIVAFSSLTTYLLNPINTLISCTDVVYAGRASLVSVYGFFDLFDTEESEHLPAIEVKGNVRFENVRFEYRNEHPVLNDINFEATPGRQIALVGSSGAGKTTLVNLVLGFYKPTSGRVLIDGVSVAEMNLRRLREQIGVVSQDNILTGGTIRNNIRYGNIEASNEQIVSAARIANAHDFITSLADGYDTEIGDRGIRLSGGQKQRIAIARAVLRDPRILILDEATSALDSESEQAVQEALDHLRRDRTAFIIAHRLSTVQSADLILVMRNGEIVERGTYAELVSNHGEFARFHRIQFARQSPPHAVIA